MSILGNNLLAQYYAQQEALPNEYRRVKYLEGVNNNQYINSNWLYSNNFIIIAKLFFTSAEQTYYNQNYFRFIFASNEKARFDMFWTTNYAYYVSGALPVIVGEYRTYTIPFVKGERININVDGVNFSAKCYSSGANLTLTHQFAECKVKTFSYQIIDNGVMVRDFVPCVRKSDGKPGMYDLCRSICPLTGTPFYINAGTGEFVTP